jgi:Ni/Co efflux regulator RcnB
MKKIFMTIALGAALAGPAILSAQPQDHHDDHRDDKYWDRKHNDHHEWNANEDKAYHRYWEDQHRKYVDWDHANQRQRDAYWAWRHNHSDQALFQVNIR